MDFLETVRAEYAAWLETIERELCLEPHDKDTCTRPLGHDRDHAEVKPSGRIVSWAASPNSRAGAATKPDRSIS